MADERRTSTLSRAWPTARRRVITATHRSLCVAAPSDLKALASPSRARYASRRTRRAASASTFVNGSFRTGFPRRFLAQVCANSVSILSGGACVAADGGHADIVAVRQFLQRSALCVPSGSLFPLLRSQGR